jgi:hypothetical protein
MIQRILGLAVGGVVTFLLLLLFQGGRIVSDTNTGYLVAILIGQVAAFFWPIVLGFWAARRVRQRREDQISAEVERQVNAQQH